MKQRGILALEDNEETVTAEPMNTAEMEASSAEAGEQLAQLQTQDQALTEAEDLQGTLDGVIEQVEARGEEPLSEGEAAMANVAVEHICMRLGVKKSPMPAMEGFADKEAAKTSTQKLLGELKTLRERVVARYEAALEAFSSGLGSAEGNLQGAQAVLHMASAQYEAKPGQTAKPISGGFLRFFGPLPAEADGVSMAKGLTHTVNVLTSGGVTQELEILTRAVKNMAGKTAETLKETPFDERISRALAALPTEVAKMKGALGLLGGRGNTTALSLTPETVNGYRQAAEAGLHKLQKAAKDIVELAEAANRIEEKVQGSVKKGWMGRIIGFLFFNMLGLLVGWWWDTYSRDKAVERKDENYRRMAESFRAGAQAIVEYEKLIADVAFASVHYIEKSAG